MKPAVLGILFGALVMAGSAQQAQAAFPDRPVTIVVPQTPGGGTDVLARIIARRLAQMWGQGVVVENRPGAGGIIGLENIAKSPADGYRILMSSDGPQAINPSLYKSQPYDTVKDFTPIATVGTVPFVLAVKSNYQARNLNELVTLSQSGDLTFGSAGNGSLNHLIGEMINQATKMKLKHVPYKGAEPAITDLLGMHITAVVSTVPSIASAIDSGSVRGLAVTTIKRSSRIPNVPTVAELGYGKFDVSPWIGLLGPANLPSAIVTKINTDVNASLQEPEVQKAILDLGIEPYPHTQEEFKAILKSSIEDWGAIIRKANVSID